MTSKENIVFGGIYKLVKGANKLLRYVPGGMHGHYFNDGNTQKYGYFVPIKAYVNNTVKTFMVDTYMIDMSGMQPGLERMVKCFKTWSDPEKGSIIRAHCFDYYYAGLFELTEETAQCFELLCDLQDVEVIKDSDISKYLESDVFKDIPLYHNHNYSWCGGVQGVSLVRKSAKPDGKKSLKSAISKILNLKLDSVEYEITEVKKGLADVLEAFPDLKNEYADEIKACDYYLLALESLRQLKKLSLSPYEKTMADFVYDRRKPQLKVKTDAGKIIAEENSDEYKGIGLYFTPNGTTDKVSLAVAECHNIPEKRVADETSDDVIVYTYTDAFDEPLKHVRNAKTIIQHDVNQAVVRPLSEDDYYAVENMDCEAEFMVEDAIDAPDYAYGIFKNNKLIGYCTIGNTDLVMHDCILNDEHYDKHRSLLLSDVYIDPVERHHGFATKLVKEALKQKWDAQKYKDTVYLMVLDDAVSKFYEKLGFEWLEPREEGCMVLAGKELR